MLSYSQGFYATLEGGISLATTKQDFVYGAPPKYSENTKVYPIDYYYKKNSLGFGSGLNIGGAIGYMLNKNIGLQLGLSYFSNKEIFNAEFTYNTSMAQYAPSVLLITGNGKFKPYGRFGLIFGRPEIIEERLSKYSIASPTSTIISKKVESTREFNGGLAIGYNAEVGLQFSINDKISLVTGLELISLNYKPEKSSYTKVDINDIDELSSLTNRERYTEYVESFSTRTNNSHSVPRKRLEESFSFGSFGISLGLKYDF